MTEQARIAINLALNGASSTTQKLSRMRGGLGGLHDSASRAAADLFHVMQVGKDLFRMFASAGRGAINLAGALIGPQEQFESATLQFEQLLGSTDRAQSRIRELYDYARSTPFLNPDVLKASRLLQTFGGDAIGAGDGLEMVGDMAAYAQQGISEVAMWVGRAYSSMQAGRPWGEAAQRLTEMGLMSGAARVQLEALSASTASGNEVWAAFVAAMAKTRGSAARLGESMSGIKSTIAGQWQGIKRLTGQKLFVAVKQDLKDLRDDIDDAFGSGAVERFADGVGSEIAGLYSSLREQGMGGLRAEDIFAAAEQEKLGALVGIVLGGAAKNFGIAIRNAALTHGPAIQRAMIPDRLHGALGIKERSAKSDSALQSIAAGDSAAVADLTKWEQFKFALPGAMLGGNFRGDDWRQAYAQSRAESMTDGPSQMPFIDIDEQLENLLGHPKPQEVQKPLFQEEKMKTFLDNINVMAEETGRAADNARELNRQLGKGVRAVF